MGNGTPIGTVRASGSAKAGAHHWLAQRFTAIGLLVLGAWLITSLLMLPNLSFYSVHDWAGHLVPASGLVLLVVCALWHARLGVAVMVEDYVHDEGSRFGVMALLNLLAFGGGAIGLIAILRIAVGGGQ